MHLADGLLPPLHAAAWAAAAAPALAAAVRRRPADDPAVPVARFQLAAAAGLTLVLSALKLPSVAGSSSHPTGVALGVRLVGAPRMAVVALVVLLLQALFLAHGGLTTLGANLVSMGVVGPWAAAAAFAAGARLGWSSRGQLTVATLVANLGTYVTTAGQLALAHPDATRGRLGAWLTYLALFGVVQVPVAIAEAWLSWLAAEALPRPVVAVAT